MTDRIYTYQQKLIIQYIEDIGYLFNQPVRSRRQIKEILNSLIELTEGDKSIPDRLKPSIYFKSRKGLWRGRAMIPDIRSWMVKLHQHIDDTQGKNALR
jgi:hypothetical protein